MRARPWRDARRRVRLSVISRRQLPRLIALPLIVLGSLAARWTAAVCIPPPTGETGNETGEHAHTLAAHAGQWPLLLGLLGALIAVGAAGHVHAVRARRRASSSFPPSLFFCLPPLAFLIQEAAERAFGTEPAGALLGRQLLLGVALQVPFALLSYLSARLLVGVAERIGQALAAGLPAAARRRVVLPFASSSIELTRIAALALGYGERGPPLLA